MPLDDQDKQWIRATLAELIGGQPKLAVGPSSLTVEEFATAVRLHPEVVRRKIRTSEISPAHVFRGTRPIRISVLALAQFGVSAPEVAALSRPQCPQPSSA